MHFQYMHTQTRTYKVSTTVEHKSDRKSWVKVMAVTLLS